MANVMFKNVDEKVLREFKSEAVLEGKTFAQALVEALLAWIESRHQHTKKKRLLDIKPMNFGRGSEKLSTEVDKIVYG